MTKVRISFSVARAGVLLEGGRVVGRGHRDRATATGMRRPRLHGLEQPAGDLRLGDSHLHLRR